MIATAKYAYGFFRDEMEGGHDYYDVFRWFFFILVFDLICSFFIDPFFLHDGNLLTDIFEGHDLICFLFLVALPVIYFSDYLRENGFAMMQGAFLYVVVFGWLPFIVFDLLFEDVFYFLFILAIYFDYFIMYDEEDIID